MFGGLDHLVERRREAEARGAQAEPSGGEIADAVAVERHHRRARRGHDVHPDRLDLFEHLGADRLDLGDDIIGLVALDRGAQQFLVEHREDLGFVGDLHRRRAGIGVARDDIGAEALGRDGEFLAELARAEEEDLRGVRHRASCRWVRAALKRSRRCLKRRAPRHEDAARSPRARPCRYAGRAWSAARGCRRRRAQIRG